MDAVPGRWRPDHLSEEARRLAESAARRDGVPLRHWLAQAIRRASSAENVPAPTALARAAAKSLALLAQSLASPVFPPLDEARAYHRLMREFGLSMGEIAAGIARPREHVERALRLLALPASVRELVERRALSAEHAYALTESRDPGSLAQAAPAHGLAADEPRAPARADTGKSG
jgi:ParB family chromosome partitioning protein